MQILFFLFSLVIVGCSLKEGNSPYVSEGTGALVITETNDLKGRVFIDGYPTQKTTRFQLSGIPKGNHIVSIYLEGYKIKKLPVVISDELSIQEVTLEKSNSNNSSTITTFPEAEVWLDGLMIGYGSQVITNLEDKDHTLQIKAGNRYVDTSFNINEDLSLLPLPQKQFLIEHFSNVNCRPCPAVDRSVEKVLLSAPSQKFNHLAIHTNSPNKNDPIYLESKSDVDERYLGTQSYFDVLAAPLVLVDGYKAQYAEPDSLGIPNYLNNELNVQEIPKIALQIVIEGTSEENTYGFVHIESFANISNPRLVVALTQNELSFDAPPGTNGLKDYIDVFRAFAKHETLPIQLNSGDKMSIPFSLSQKWGAHELNIVAWVEEPLVGGPGPSHNYPFKSVIQSVKYPYHFQHKDNL